MGRPTQKSLKKLIFNKLLLCIIAHQSLLLWQNDCYGKNSSNPQINIDAKNQEAEEFLKIAGKYKSIATLKSKYENKDIYTWQHPYEHIPDKDLGFRHPPSSQIRTIRRTEQKILTDVVYNFDNYGRRKNPIPLNTLEKEKFIAIFGCSFAYGNLLNDDQTLGYYLTSLSKKYYAYNYAIGASAPNISLAQLQQLDTTTELPLKNGIFVHVYIPDHLFRANGFMDQLRWMASSPVFKKKNNRMIKLGSFEEIHNIKVKVFSFLRESINFLGNYRVNLPFLRKAHFQYVCDLFKEMKIHSKNLNSEFLIAVHPIGYMQKGLKKCLESNQIEIFETSKDYKSADHRIYLDGHPSAKTTFKFANEILTHIEKIKGRPQNLTISK